MIIYFIGRIILISLGGLCTTSYDQKVIVALLRDLSVNQRIQVNIKYLNIEDGSLVNSRM